jgi:NAD(P)-dependent dehydrogenase (short-subunit alcohol dehydrogenase family)
VGRLDGKVAVITGAARGIGRRLAQVFVAEGARVVAGDINGEGIGTLIAELGHNQCDGIEMDVCDESGSERLVARAVRRFGRLDIAVNNAGHGGFGMVDQQSAEDFRHIVDVTLTGVFLGVKHQARQLIAQGTGGSIVNIASLQAAQPSAGLAAHCAAKAGVAMLTKVAALELGPHRIRVNAIGPGLVAGESTVRLRSIPGMEQAYLESTALGEVTEQDDVAKLAVFLATDEARLMTGQLLYVDAGANLAGGPNLMKLQQQ